jgi:TPR repeat protein
MCYSNGALKTRCVLKSKACSQACAFISRRLRIAAGILIARFAAGDGVAKDTDESLRLLEIASSRGNGRARGVLQQIMLDRMAKEEAAAANARKNSRV